MSLPQLKLNRPLAFISTETTGTDPQRDRVITFAAIRVTPENTISRTEIWCNPGVPIPPEATAVHGITDEMVAGKKPFAAHEDILAILEGCDLCGYNLLNFDVPILWEEFYRAGLKWDLSGIHIIDAGNIFKLKEPRDLTAAVKRYCGRDHAGAHGANADAEATRDVLLGQLASYADLPRNVEDLSKFSRMDNRVDLAGTIVRDKDGDYAYTHKRVNGVKVKKDLACANWMLRSDFSAETKMHLERILDEIYPRTAGGRPLF